MVNSAPSARPTSRLTRWGLFRVVLVFVLFVLFLFLPAGRWDLPFFWIFWGSFLVFVLLAFATVGRKDPDLWRERFHPGPGRRERRTRPLLIPCVLGSWIVAGLDVGRYHWSDTVPPALQFGALMMVWLGLAGWLWAMMTNRFFSSEVRIQTERGHQVVTGGPYQYLRHPGYLSAILLFVASPIALGSVWAVVPALGTTGVFIWRTSFEDRILRAELAGYADYAARVRFRLLPGVW